MIETRFSVFRSPSPKWLLLPPHPPKNPKRVHLSLAVKKYSTKPAGRLPNSPSEVGLFFGERALFSPISRLNCENYCVFLQFLAHN